MKLSDHERAQGGTITISEEQFGILVKLLTPGYELALAYKAQMERPPEVVEPAAPPETPAPEPTKIETVEAPVKVVPPAPEPLS